MGITDLNVLLKSECPDVFEDIHISEYAFKKVAIDTSLYLQTFKASMGSQWLSAFIRFVACLRHNELHCVFIYDGGAHPEKELERKERKKKRMKRVEDQEHLETDLDSFLTGGPMSEKLEKFYNKFDPPKPQSMLLRPLPRSFNKELLQEKVQEERAKMDISSDDFEITKELFDILNVPWYVAPLEAETICSDLCRRGKVDAVLSRDTDVLAYGSTVLVSDLNTRTGVCRRVCHSKILDSLELSAESFLDLCIMCGTDYNKRIRGIGPKIAFKLIKEHKSIDAIADNTSHDTSILNHTRSRQLFTEYEQMTEKIPYCAPPDFEKLKKFVLNQGINMNVDTLRSCFIRQDVIVVEDED